MRAFVCSTRLRSIDQQVCQLGQILYLPVLSRAWKFHASVAFYLPCCDLARRSFHQSLRFVCRAVRASDCVTWKNKGFGQLLVVCPMLEGPVGSGVDVVRSR